MRKQYNRYLVQSSGSGIMEGVVEPMLPVGSADSSDSDSDEKESTESSDEEDVTKIQPQSKKDSGKTTMGLEKSGRERATHCARLIYELRNEVNELEKELEGKNEMITHLQVLSSNDFNERIQMKNENIELKSEIEALTSELHDEQSRLEVYRNHAVMHLNEIAEREKSIETLKEEVKTLKEEISSMTPRAEKQAFFDRVRSENASLKLQLKTMETSDKEKDETIKDLEQKLFKLQNETRLMLQPNSKPNPQPNPQPNTKPHANARKKK